MSDANFLSPLEYQRELFSILEEFFAQVAGGGIEIVGGIEVFPEWVRRNAEPLADRSQPAYEWAVDNLIDLYERARKQGVYEGIHRLAGLKLVFGGGSRFTGSHLSASRRVLLYADTILIPDPVLPWIEAPRPWKKFPRVQLLEAAFCTLHLKPLVDVDLPHPPVIVFPSWEKSLEEQDPTTQAGQQELMAAVVGSKMGLETGDLSDLRALAESDRGLTLEVIEREGLFVAPGLDIGTPLAQALPAYRDYLAEWRTADFLKKVQRMPDANLALLGISERLYPQYHLLENAETLGAHPLFALPAHSHYFRLISDYLKERLAKLGFFDPHSVAEIEALNSLEFDWLGDLPIEALVELRLNGENEDFRTRIRQYTQILSEASLDDIERVAGEVSRGISSLIRDQAKEIRTIDSKYNRHDLHTLILAGTTLAASFVPALAPFVGGPALLAPVGKLVWDRVSEVIDRKSAAKSLMGVLAHTRGETGT